jgi:phosphoglucomutase
MAIHPLAGKTAPRQTLIDIGKLEREYYEHEPDPADPNQLVSFGTSGHRGTPSKGTFAEAHILAIAQAICDYRRTQKIDGPICMGKDSHALSAAAQRTALEVLAANGIETFIQAGDGFTPTPVISRAILVYNRDRRDGLADGIVITPSHNPPADGGFKYNPPNGGPADTHVTTRIQERANVLLRSCNKAVKRMTPHSALAGDPIISRLTRAPGNNEPIGGLKVETASGWIAARPSGTENIYKLYAESFKGPQHLEAIIVEAQQIVIRSLGDR